MTNIDTELLIQKEINKYTDYRKEILEIFWDMYEIDNWLEITIEVEDKSSDEALKRTIYGKNAIKWYLNMILEEVYEQLRVKYPSDSYEESWELCKKDVEND